MDTTSTSRQPGRIPAAPAFHAPKPNAPLMWALGFANRWLLLRRYFRVRSIELPSADRSRLAHAVNRSTAAFLAPNHPEFGFDWMMDKEISTYVAPRMASWAAHDIIDTAPGFWRRNNLVANNGGEEASAYSVGCALKGDGVLLHPEGMVHWTANKIHPLFPGIAEMATQAAAETARRGQDRPVYIVPLVWKLRYTTDVAPEMHREMELIERALGLRHHARHRVAERFVALQEEILARQMERFGFQRAWVDGLDFFNRQNAFRAHLVADLQSRYRVHLGDSTDRTIHRLRRAIVERRASESNDPALTADLDRVKEADRLGGFSRDVYDTPMLSQEQIFESLKRHRATLVRGGARNVLHNFLPTPYGPRIAHVRVPEPILIDPARATGDGAARKAYVTDLLQETRCRMQGALDAINAEIAVDLWAFSHPNPFAAHGAERAA